MFAAANKNKVPSTALWVTSTIIQLIVISTYWSSDAFALMLNLTSATTLIPSLFVAAYGLTIARRGETYEVRPDERQRDTILAALAVGYTIFMILVGGLKFIMLSALLFTPGTILYVMARREQGKPVFDDVLWVDNAKRDHFDFMNKMRERGVGVVEMHSLLAETVAIPEARI